jgi:hypothetical protein
MALLRMSSECYASEEPVVIVGIKKVHHLNIYVVFGFHCLSGVHKLRILLIRLLRGIAAVTVRMTSVLDEASLAQAEPANRAYRYSIGSWMKVAFHGTHPLLDQVSAPKPPIPRPT